MHGESDEVAYQNAFDELAGVYLEDSWVLDMATSHTALIFTLDAVLTPAHRAYRPPMPGEVHCYRRAELRLDSDSAIQIRQSQTPPAIDAAGERDYGNIDTFRLCEEAGFGVWELTGDWGDALVRHPRVRLQLYLPKGPS